jgi:hypothetical protein
MGLFRAGSGHDPEQGELVVSDDADVLADAERRDRAAVPTDGTGHKEQVHMAALDASVGRHESSVPASLR